MLDREMFQKRATILEDIGDQIPEADEEGRPYNRSFCVQREGVWKYRYEDEELVEYLRRAEIGLTILTSYEGGPPVVIGFLHYVPQENALYHPESGFPENARAMEAAGFDTSFATCCYVVDNGPARIGEVIATAVPKAYGSGAELLSQVFHEMIHSTGTVERLNRRSMFADFTPEQILARCSGDRKRILELEFYEEAIAVAGAEALSQFQGIGTEESMRKMERRLHKLMIGNIPVEKWDALYQDIQAATEYVWERLDQDSGKPFQALRSGSRQANIVPYCALFESLLLKGVKIAD